MYMKISKKKLISSMLVVVLTMSLFLGINFSSEHETKVDAASGGAAKVNASITGELTGRRTKFVKQFAMSDGSYTAATYSMPVHYKKNGKWKEIDTTLVKSGRKNYKTKATDLSIKVSKKADKKSVVSMKRGSTSLSIALNDKKIKAAKAEVSNPKKKTAMDVLNQNKVTYKKVVKNTNVSYDIFPEKI